jgi:hypothetical protein
VVLVIALFEGVIVNFDADWRLAWWRVPGDALLFAVCALPVAVGLAAAIVVIKNEWLAVVVMLALPVALAASLGAVVFLLYGDPSRTLRAGMLRPVFLQIWVAGLVGAALCAWMYRRWLAIEPGTRG